VTLNPLPRNFPTVVSNLNEHFQYQMKKFFI
jgi:hypothetical protein